MARKCAPSVSEASHRRPWLEAPLRLKDNASLSLLNGLDSCTSVALSTQNIEPNSPTNPDNQNSVLRRLLPESMITYTSTDLRKELDITASLPGQSRSALQKNHGAARIGFDDNEEHPGNSVSAGRCMVD